MFYAQANILAKYYVRYCRTVNSTGVFTMVAEQTRITFIMFYFIIAHVTRYFSH